MSGSKPTESGPVPWWRGCGCAPLLLLVVAVVGPLLLLGVVFGWHFGGIENKVTAPFTVEHRGWRYHQRPGPPPDDPSHPPTYIRDLEYRGRPLPDFGGGSLITPIGVVTSGILWQRDVERIEGALVGATREGLGASDLAAGYYDTSAREPDAGPWLDLQLEGTPEHWVYVFRTRADRGATAPSAEDTVARRGMVFWKTERRPPWPRPVFVVFARPTGAGPQPGRWGQKLETTRRGDYLAEPPGSWRPPAIPGVSYVYLRRSIARGVVSHGKRKPRVGRDAIEVVRGRYQGFWCDPERLDALPWRREFR
ncbi:MAG: hypothetical protein AAF628_10515 [Planctomycetota bacterium]